MPWSILGDSANYEHIENGGATDDKSQAGSVSVSEVQLPFPDQYTAYHVSSIGLSGPYLSLKPE